MWNFSGILFCSILNITHWPFTCWEEPSVCCPQVPRQSGAGGINSQLQTAQHQQRSSQVGAPLHRFHPKIEKKIHVCTWASSRRFPFLPAGLVFFVHAEPFVWEAEFLQRPGHLGAVGRRGGKHHRHAVLVQCQHRRGAFTQVQQQSHAGEVERNWNQMQCHFYGNLTWRPVSFIKTQQLTFTKLVLIFLKPLSMFLLFSYLSIRF